jgi:triphosphoribosyl-dephospho-CoA synthase
MWQRGGNTLLGAVILLSPIAVAAGAVFAKGEFSIKKLRERIGQVVTSTTAEDAVNVYEAIEIAQPGGLGKAPDLDVNNPKSKMRILEENISLYEVFKIASAYDSVCSEWVNNYPATFDVGYPFFQEEIKNTNDVNLATVNTFLKILAEVPDTLIVRKAGREKAKEISLEAKEILELGGLKTEIGKKRLIEFDRKLRSPRNSLNPGTTADILSAVLALSILEGYRP